LHEAINVTGTPTHFALRQLRSEGDPDRDDRGRLAALQLTRSGLQDFSVVRNVPERAAANRAVREELDRSRASER